MDARRVSIGRLIMTAVVSLSSYDAQSIDNRKLIVFTCSLGEFYIVLDIIAP